jgi:hypothetical protein
MHKFGATQLGICCEGRGQVAQIDYRRRAKTPVAIRAFKVMWVAFLVLASAACADVVPPPNGAGGSGGAGGTGGMPPECNLDSLEANDVFDGFVAQGTVDGTCQIVGELIDCQGPDVLDQWPLEVEQSAPHRIELTWSNAASDLDLGVFDEVTCDVLDGATNREGTQEVIEIFLESGTEPIITVFAIDTNNSPEIYELSATIIE